MPEVSQAIIWRSTDKNMESKINIISETESMPLGQQVPKNGINSNNMVKKKLWQKKSQTLFCIQDRIRAHCNCRSKLKAMLTQHENTMLRTSYHSHKIQTSFTFSPTENKYHVMRKRIKSQTVELKLKSKSHQSMANELPNNFELLQKPD